MRTHRISIPVMAFLLLAFTAPVPPSGDLVAGFGKGGVVTSNSCPGRDEIGDMVHDGKFLYVFWTSAKPGEWDWQWCVEKRSLSKGFTVGKFGTKGLVESNPSKDMERAAQMAIDSNALYLLGTDQIAGISEMGWRIEKRSLTDGSLVPEFGKGGIVSETVLGTKSNIPECVAVDKGFLYVAGWGGGFSEGYWRLEKRSVQDGSLVPEFGKDGVVQEVIEARFIGPNDIAIDGSALYVVGIPGWRVEKRSLSDGSLDAAFGTEGVVTGDPEGKDLRVEGIALDASSMYLVGAPGWRIEKRSLKDGALDKGFGSEGVLSGSPETGEGRGAVVEGGALYVAGFEGPETSRRWRVEKRKTADGTLEPDFGMGGVILGDPGKGENLAGRVILDESSLYVLGQDTSPGEKDTQIRIEKRTR